MSGLNRTEIQWADYTLNPVVGCSNGCPYCYARTTAQRFDCPDCETFNVHHHPRRWQALKGGKPGKVFLGSMGDMFDPGVNPTWWRYGARTLYQLGCQHKLLVLTKRPDRITEVFDQAGFSSLNSPRHWSGTLLKALWLGVTVTCQEDLWRVEELVKAWSGPRFVSVEPLLGPVDLGEYLPVLDWVIIGGLAGSWLPDGWTIRTSLLQAQSLWARDLIGQARKASVPAFLKTKPVRLPDILPFHQERPAGLIFHQTQPQPQPTLFEDLGGLAS